MTEEFISKIDKRKQPELQILNVLKCSVSGKKLFDPHQNSG